MSRFNVRFITTNSTAQYFGSRPSGTRASISSDEPSKSLTGLILKRLFLFPISQEEIKMREREVGRVCIYFMLTYSISMLLYLENAKVSYTVPVNSCSQKGFVYLSLRE